MASSSIAFACNFQCELANCLMRVLSRFLTSATDAARFPPPTLPEIAFLGRSNVGKSSLINSLLGSKIAKTSSTPGRTRAVNFFEVRWAGKPHPELIFTDLPGYGYAKISREISAQWPGFIEPYLLTRESLALCVALIDINVPPQEKDKLLFDFLESSGRPFLIVATKSDRLSGNQLHNALRTMEHNFPQARIMAYSARTGVGRDELWKEIQAAMSNHLGEGNGQ
jgi:GTP-binding protein